MKRNEFISGCTDWLSTMAMGGQGNFSFHDSEDSNKDILVVLFLRGACDGLNLLAPTSDPEYQAARGGNLGIATSGNRAGIRVKNGATDQDFRFFHKAEGLAELYSGGDMAAIHASGLTNGTRSHFEAMDLMERGTDKDKTLTQGWITRLMMEGKMNNGISAYTMGGSQPGMLMASENAMSAKNIKDLNLDWDDKAFAVLEEMYKGESSLHKNGSLAIGGLNTIRREIKKNPNHLNYKPEKGVYPDEWPGKELGDAMSSISQLIKMDVGLKVATADFGGWDTHDGQEWRFEGLVNAMSQALAAFYEDLYRYHNKLTVVVMSEFGRRVKPNGNGGTDHGHGNCMFVLGGNVNGGKMYGEWPGLHIDQLDNRVDLAITTDYRRVLSEMMSKRLKIDNHQTVLPGYKYDGAMGLFKSA